jgi:hypothetical protein
MHFVDLLGGCVRRCQERRHLISPWWSFTLSVLGILAMWQVGNKRLLGWVLGVVCELTWIAYAYYTRQPWFYVGSLAYIAVYLRNWRRWRSVSG